ncbi:MAG TPA: 3-deoxy-D-manno-octulosonic acid transferase, partial [Gammaproteobacteria bacterium]|nr:3-deoxy-D-manno-octulosonic acid transferase [Gammaproteobacteria bacterium]
HEAGALTVVQDPDSLAAAAAWLLGNDSTRESIGRVAREKVLENRGALDRALALVKANLPRH